jgi:hypothetical protein
VTPCRADPFVFVEDLCRGLEELLKPVRPVQGAWPPEPENIADFFGNIDVPVRSNFLPDQLQGKDCREIIRPYWLVGLWMERGVQRGWEISLDIIPSPGYLLLV